MAWLSLCVYHPPVPAGILHALIPLIRCAMDLDARGLARNLNFTAVDRARVPEPAAVRGNFLTLRACAPLGRQFFSSSDTLFSRYESLSSFS